ncbi:hypothetical protein Tco_0763611 [Tanacetum coccineum]
MKRVTASFARSLKESHMVMKTGPRMTLSRNLSTNDIHKKLHGLCTNEEKVSKIFKELLFGREKKYEVKKVVNNGVSDVIKSDVLKTGSMGIDVVKGEDVVISDTLKDEGMCDAVTSNLVKTGSIGNDVVKGEDVVISAVSDGGVSDGSDTVTRDLVKTGSIGDDVVKGEDIVISTVSDGGVSDGIEGVTMVIGDGWVMDVGNRLCEASVAFLKELVDAALGN